MNIKSRPHFETIFFKTKSLISDVECLLLGVIYKEDKKFYEHNIKLTSLNQLRLLFLSLKDDVLKSLKKLSIIFLVAIIISFLIYESNKSLKSQAIEFLLIYFCLLIAVFFTFLKMPSNKFDFVSKETIINCKIYIQEKYGKQIDDFSQLENCVSYFEKQSLNIISSLKKGLTIFWGGFVYICLRNSFEIDFEATFTLQEIFNDLRGYFLVFICICIYSLMIWSYFKAVTTVYSLVYFTLSDIRSNIEMNNIEQET